MKLWIILGVFFILAFIIYFLTKKNPIKNQAQELKIYLANLVGNLVNMVKQIKEFKKRDAGDVSLYSDLISAISELTCAEKHSLNNAEINREKDNKRYKRWLEISEQLRKIRHKWMGLLINKKYDYEELLCETKHLLNASKNLIEVGNKLSDLVPEYSDIAYQDRIKLIEIVIEMNDLDKLEGGKK